MSYKVEVFISEECGEECNKLFQFFKERHIPYHIRNVTRIKSWIKILHDHHVYVTPAVFYGESNYILGYQRSKLEEIFGS